MKATSRREVLVEMGDQFRGFLLSMDEVREILSFDCTQDVRFRDHKSFVFLGGSYLLWKKALRVISHDFDASFPFSHAFIIKTQGLLMDDKTMASALWRNVYCRDCASPVLLERMIQYVRTQVFLIVTLLFSYFLCDSLQPSLCSILRWITWCHLTRKYCCCRGGPKRRLTGDTLNRSMCPDRRHSHRRGILS